MAQLVGCIEGMAEAARALDMPVVSGNVSLYNETNGVAIPPTPAVGAVGLIEDLSKRVGIGGAKEGDILVLVGEKVGDIGQSLYTREVLALDGSSAGAPPSVELETEYRHGVFVRQLINEGLIDAAHDISDGGLAVAATEMALAGDIGVRLHAGASAPLAAMFAEDQGRYLLAVPLDNMDVVWDRMKAEGIPGGHVGEVTQEDLWLGDRTEPGVLITFEDKEKGHGVALSILRAAHEGWLPRYMRGAA